VRATAMTSVESSVCLVVVEISNVHFVVVEIR
jgi:hypothetical protein